MTDDGVRVWSFLRCDRSYRAAWREHDAPPDREDGPFPVRIQSEADLDAAEPWRMLAWEDPFVNDGPASPFWADAPMIEGEWSARATPLLALLADAGARIAGLRLRDGGLVLKVENHGVAVQVRVADAGLLLDGGGVRLVHDWGRGLPVDIACLTDLWAVSGGPVPRSGRGRGAMTGSC